MVCDVSSLSHSCPAQQHIGGETLGSTSLFRRSDGEEIIKRYSVGLFRGFALAHQEGV